MAIRLIECGQNIIREIKEGICKDGLWEKLNKQNFLKMDIKHCREGGHAAPGG